MIFQEREEKINVIMENRANLLKSLGESLRNTVYFETIAYFIIFGRSMIEAVDLHFR